MRYYFKKYLSIIPLGLISIFRFTSSLETLAIIIYLFLLRFLLIYASALTNIIITNFTKRFYRINKSIAKSYNKIVPLNT